MKLMILLMAIAIPASSGDDPLVTVKRGVASMNDMWLTVCKTAARPDAVNLCEYAHKLYATAVTIKK